MKRLIIALMMVALCASVGSATAATTETHPDVPRITQQKLESIMGKPGVVLIDVRLPEQWEISDKKLPGAVHEDQGQVNAWAGKYPKDATIILY